MTGGAAYVQDMRLPGMLHGRVVRPPRYGAKLESFDEAAVKAMPGVIAVVRDGSFLGVVAEREEQAIKARDALDATATLVGRRPELPDPAKIYEHLLSLRDGGQGHQRQAGAAARTAPRSLEATYTGPTWRTPRSVRPARSPQFKDGKLTVWTHSQGVFPLRATWPRRSTCRSSAIRCIHAEGSGCYGHNGADDVALDAALLARAAAGRPVRVQWMRDDEFKWEPYRPRHGDAGASAALKDGRIVDWSYDVWSNTHNMRPGDPGRRQSAGELVPGQAEAARSAARPAAAGRRRRPQRDPALRLAAPAHHQPPDQGDAAAGLGAAHARRLRQRVRDRILHGRAGGGGAAPIRSRSGSRISRIRAPRR